MKTTSATNSPRPVAVSSMSSLDSSSFLDAEFDKAFENEQMPVADANNVVSSSTLSSIVGASPTLTGISEQQTESTNYTNSATGPSGMLLAAPVPSAPTARLPSAAPAPAPSAESAPNSNTVAEFLFQLSKMLTDDNKEIIEWSNGMWTILLWR